MKFTLIESFSKLSTYQVVIFLSLFIFSIIAFLFLKTKMKKQTKKINIMALTIGALCVSLAFVLSYIKIFSLPQGGSLTAASMLPIMLYCFWYKPKKGLIVCVAYGLLQYIQEPFFLNGIQFSLDYIVAFAVLCVVGFFPKNKILFALVVGGALRFVVHTISGAIFFGIYAPPGTSVLAYSLVYNTVILADTAICVFVAAVALKKNLFETLEKQTLGFAQTR